MILVPVIDLMRGQVVRAAARRPPSRIGRSCRGLCAGSDPVEVARALCRHCDSRQLYAADLDALMGGGPQHDVVRAAAAGAARARTVARRRLCRRRRRPTRRASASAPAAQRVVPVFGSESLRSRAALQGCFAGGRDGLLSLDRRDGQRLDEAGCWDAPSLWPQRVIVMTLERVGADAGPDLDTLREVQARVAGDPTDRCRRHPQRGRPGRSPARPAPTPGWWPARCTTAAWPRCAAPRPEARGHPWPDSHHDSCHRSLQRPKAPFGRPRRPESRHCVALLAESASRRSARGLLVTSGTWLASSRLDERSHRGGWHHCATALDLPVLPAGLRSPGRARRGRRRGAGIAGRRMPAREPRAGELRWLAATAAPTPRRHSLRPRRRGGRRGRLAGRQPAAAVRRPRHRCGRRPRAVPRWPAPPARSATPAPVTR